MNNKKRACLLLLFGRSQNILVIVLIETGARNLLALKTRGVRILLHGGKCENMSQLAYYILKQPH